MCGCQKKREFEYVAPDGSVTVVKSQAEAVQMVRDQGGTWRIKR
jgi:hypothetical protein